MSNVVLRGSLSDFLRQWVVYAAHDFSTLELLYVGHCPFAQMTAMPDLRAVPGVDHDRQLAVRVLHVWKNRASAVVAASREVSLNNRPVWNQAATMKRHGMIKCVDTGEVFHSAAECARAKGIAQSNLANHLNNKPGHKKVNGMQFIRLTTTG